MQPLKQRIQKWERQYWMRMIEFWAVLRGKALRFWVQKKQDVPVVGTLCIVFSALQIQRGLHSVGGLLPWVGELRKVLEGRVWIDVPRLQDGCVGVQNKRHTAVGLAQWFPPYCFLCLWTPKPKETPAKDLSAWRSGWEERRWLWGRHPWFCCVKPSMDQKG